MGFPSVGRSVPHLSMYMYAPSGATLALTLFAVLNIYFTFSYGKSSQSSTTIAIPVYLSEGGLTISVSVASKTHQLALSGRLEGIYLFSNKIPNCQNCYDPEKSNSAEWCNNPNEKCNPIISKFVCNRGKKLDYNWAVK